MFSSLGAIRDFLWKGKVKCYVHMCEIYIYIHKSYIYDIEYYLVVNCVMGQNFSLGKLKNVF